MYTWWLVDAVRLVLLQGAVGYSLWVQATAEPDRTYGMWRLVWHRLGGALCFNAIVSLMMVFFALVTEWAMIFEAHGRKHTDAGYPVPNWAWPTNPWVILDFGTRGVGKLHWPELLLILPLLVICGWLTLALRNAFWRRAQPAELVWMGRILRNCYTTATNRIEVFRSCPLPEFRSRELVCGR